MRYPRSRLMQTIRQGALWTLLGLLGLAAIDLGTETFIVGSPSRWVIGALVSASIGLVASVTRIPWLRERLDLAARVFMGLTLFLVLLAVVPVLPGSIENGPVLAGQSSGFLLKVVSLAGVLRANSRTRPSPNVRPRITVRPWPCPAQ